MAAKNKPAGIRSLVYGIGKGKVRIEGLSVSQQRHVFKVKVQHFCGRLVQKMDPPIPPLKRISSLYSK